MSATAKTLGQLKQDLWEHHQYADDALKPICKALVELRGFEADMLVVVDDHAQLDASGWALARDNVAAREKAIQAALTAAIETVLFMSGQAADMWRAIEHTPKPGAILAVVSELTALPASEQFEAQRAQLLEKLQALVALGDSTDGTREKATASLDA